MLHFVQRLQRPQQARQHDAVVEVLARCLFGLVLGYSIFIPYSWTQHRDWQWLFFQLHTLVFAGSLLIIAITLVRMPPQQPLRYRLLCALLGAANLLTIIVAVFDVSSYQSSGTEASALTWSMVLYVIIYAAHTLSLSYIAPLRTFPRLRLLQLIADTLLAFVLADIALRLVLPLSNAWVWTPITSAVQFRLVTSIGVSFWYISLYRQFAAFNGRPAVLWGVGLLAMLATDALFLWGTALRATGAPDDVFSLAIPFWDLHQLLWALGLYWATRRNLRWRTEPEHRPYRTIKPGWWIVARQSVLLTVLVLISNGVVPSMVALIWLVSALVMRESLSMYEREQLIHLQRTTQDELQQANHNLAVYAAQAEELGIANERNRVARELHDSLGHYFTTINVYVGSAQRLIEKNRAQALLALEQADHLAQEGLNAVRRSVAALRESPLERRTLLEAINGLVDGCHEAGLQAVLQVVGTPRLVSQQITTTVYRIAQEALTNVRRHAQATRVDVQLDYTIAGVVQLVVQDNGRGATSVAGGFGLIGMRERASLLGGKVRVHTEPGQGFRIEMEVPA